MKKSLQPLNVTIVLMMLCFSASAATVFDNGDPTDSYLSTPGNWNNGLPSAANPGTISTNANCGNNTLTNFVVTQTAGSITMGGFPQTSITFDGGSWTMNGGSINCRAHTYKNGHIFTLNDGALTTVNNSYMTADSSGSQLIVNGGTINADRGIKIIAGGEITFNGGTITSDEADAFGAFGFNGRGTMNFNGGELTGGRLTFQGTTLATFGGTTAGTATFVNWGNEDSSDRHNDDVMSIDFLPGSLMSLTLTAPRSLVFSADTNTVYATNAWAEALWETGRLTYGGDDYTVLGDWATVSSTGFGDGASFDFDASGGGSLALGDGSSGSTNNVAVTLDMSASTLAFLTDNSSTYSVQVSTNLVDGFTVLTTLSGDGSTNTVIVDTSYINGFYQVKEISSP